MKTARIPAAAGDTKLQPRIVLDPRRDSEPAEDLAMADCPDDIFLYYPGRAL